MPRVERTRFIRAIELLERLERGPALTFLGRRDLTTEQQQRVKKDVADSYRIWSESWILEEVKALIPELRDEARVTRARRGPTKESEA